MLRFLNLERVSCNKTAREAAFYFFQEVNSAEGIWSVNSRFAKALPKRSDRASFAEDTMRLVGSQPL